MCFCFRKFDFFVVEPGRNGKAFVTLRDDVHGFIDACLEEIDAGRDLYDVVKEYEARRQARRAVSHRDLPLSIQWGA